MIVIPVAVAYRGDGEYRVFRMLATNQRLRAKLTGHRCCYALQVSALVDRRICNEAWDTDIHLRSEGLGHGDLFVQGVGMRSTPIRELIEEYGVRSPGRHVLSCQDEGSIEDYEKSFDEGWWLYTKTEPESRRRCLVRTMRDDANRFAVLAFDRDECIVFSHERTVIVFGAAISNEQQAWLVDLVGDWRRDDDRAPLVIALGGECEINSIAGFPIAQLPAELSSDADRSLWLKTLLRDEKWIDVAMFES